MKNIDDIQLSDIKIGDTVHCEKQISAGFSGPAVLNKHGEFVPLHGGSHHSEVKFTGKVYGITGSILHIDLPSNGAASVHYKHVVKLEKQQEVTVAA